MNDFLTNNPGGFSQAYDDGEDNEIWNKYWNDWVTPDTNEDGVVDNPYSIKGTANNYDPYPRTITCNKKYIKPIPQNLVLRLVLLLLISSTLIYLKRK